MKEKTAGQQLQDKLFFTPKNQWETLSAKDEKALEDFAAAYRRFLDEGKTERECAASLIAELKKKGFADIDALSAAKVKAGLKAGDRVYRGIHGKSVLCAVIGGAPSGQGFNIIGAHIDSPRIDLKTNPLYEDGDLALLDTHYYGGIKKYQWTAIPLALHGLFVTADGREVTLRLGEDDADPVFTITDLLPHLAREQMQKKAAEFVDAEDLDALVGSRPYDDEKVKEKVKLNILAMLNKAYGITEEDFAGAELELVPAFKARDLGFDRSMIGAYGHDDRCCAWPAFRALLDIADSKTAAKARTSICYLSDKEEIGSYGNTGAQSVAFENFIVRLCELMPSGGGAYRQCLASSAMLSADVNSGYDPSYSGLFDKKNASFMGRGLLLAKYTGSGGKVGASDANAEFLRKVQRLLNDNKIGWQFGDLGKVDKGGGGTIAHTAARLGVNVLDCGIPVLSMHSPFEVISKVDLYTAYKGYAAFYRGMSIIP